MSMTMTNNYFLCFINQCEHDQLVDEKSADYTIPPPAYEPFTKPDKRQSNN